MEPVAHIPCNGCPTCRGITGPLETEFAPGFNTPSTPHHSCPNRSNYRYCSHLSKQPPVEQKNTDSKVTALFQKLLIL
ncbi:hypothetical protein DFAR_130011 [Desulfarculales bacterium]